MRNTLLLLVILGALLVAGCSGPSPTTPGDRSSQAVVSGMSPTLAFQLNATCFIYPEPLDHLLPLDIPLGEQGLSPVQILCVLEGGTLVNACCPYEVDVPEWDEWLLATFYEVDVPEWDEWLLLQQSFTFPLYVDVPEWDEWLLRFRGMDIYRSDIWEEWAFFGPNPLEVDVPEWDEWLLSLTLGEIAESYDAWWMVSMPIIF